MEFDLANLKDIPPELQFNIALQLDLPSLYSLCLTSRQLAGICQDDAFWKEKYSLTYGQTRLSPDLSWKDSYRFRYSRQINSPLNASMTEYSIIDQNGVLYMTGQNVWSEGKFIKSDNFIPLNIPSKVISFSTHHDKSSITYMAALTENGIYLWEYYYFLGTTKPAVGRGPSLHEEYQNCSSSLRNQPIKILTDSHRYILLMDDGNLLIWSKNKGFRLINTEAIDIFKPPDPLGSVEKYYFLGKDGGLYQLHMTVLRTDYINMFGIDNMRITVYDLPKQITKTRINIPEPVKQYIGSRSIESAITETGNVYIWGEYFYTNDGALNGNGRQIGQPEKINLPEPIFSMSIFDRSIAAVSVTGRLYIWGNNSRDRLINSDDIPFSTEGPFEDESKAVDPEPIQQLKTHFANGIRKGVRLSEIMLPNILEIDLGQLVTQVVIGRDFNLALTIDGVINIWSGKSTGQE